MMLSKKKMDQVYSLTDLAVSLVKMVDTLKMLKVE